jgi:tetratricopeptide (TPR) repeat protein
MRITFSSSSSSSSSFFSFFSSGPLLVVFVLASLAAGETPAQTPAPLHAHYEKPAGYDRQAAPGAPLAPRLQNLGVHRFPVTTRSNRAQLFINQGINLTYGFNHAEAGRAFAEAARLDPDCAMAYWGQALVLGPNINAAMEADAEPKALELVRKAVALKPKASARERAYIDALTVRYTGKSADRPAADRAFADAMRKMSQTYRDDADARTIFAESLMDLRPWNYWTRDGQPHAETREIQAALEQVLAKNPNHPGALHYWIHLWEPTDTPERAEAEADRLLPLMPGAGHIVHMPAHIYMRVGRHGDVVTSNQLAAKADEDYIAQCNAQGLYPLGYYPHNVHFIWMGATASGRSRLALESANKVAAAIPREALAAVPILQGFLAVPYWAKVQFGQWPDILADKGPEHDTPFMRGVWRYARARALVATGQLQAADTELGQLKVIVEDPALKANITFSNNTGYAILRIAPEVVAGELAAKRKEWDAALLHLERAVRFEDALIYTEPADWAEPARQILGAVLLEAGRPDEAEAVYWEDLRKNSGNGWSLYGLLQALKAQKKDADAALIQERFEKVWKDADITLGASRIGS